MRICVIGLPTSGKTTVFKALTGAEDTQAGAQAATVRAIRVPDQRVDELSALYSPKKTTYASVEYVDLGADARIKAAAGELGSGFLNAVRPAAALVHVVDGFSLPEAIDDSVAEAVEAIDTELVLSDLGVCEKRITRLKKEGVKTGPAKAELALLERATALLGEGKPLRVDPEVAGAHMLRGYTLLSSKPVITVVNTAEGNESWTPAGLPEEIRATREGDWGRFIPLCGQLESEIAALDREEAMAFLGDFGIEEPARERVIALSYDLLGLQSFYTAGDDEVRAWTIRRGAEAQEAAGAIHTDIARGFIRAEVVSYDDVMACGGFDQARSKGKMRLEGKSYVMGEADVVSFRFNV